MVLGTRFTRLGATIIIFSRIKDDDLSLGVAVRRLRFFLFGARIDFLDLFLDVIDDFVFNCRHRAAPS